MCSQDENFSNRQQCQKLGGAVRGDCETYINMCPGRPIADCEVHRAILYASGWQQKLCPGNFDAAKVRMTRNHRFRRRGKYEGLFTAAFLGDAPARTIDAEYFVQARKLREGKGARQAAYFCFCFTVLARGKGARSKACLSKTIATSREMESIFLPENKSVARAKHGPRLKWFPDQENPIPYAT